MVEAVQQAALHFLHAYGYAALFVLLALETAMILHFIPSEVIVTVAAGALAVDATQLALVIVVSTLGATAGSLALYGFARYGGRSFLQAHPRLLGLNAARLDRLDAWFRRPAGELLVFFFRLLPFLRAAVSIPAGLASMDVRKFTLYSAAGSALFNAALAYSAYAVRSSPDVMAELRKVLAYAATRWPFFLVLALAGVAGLYLLYRRRHAYRDSPHLALRDIARTSALVAVASGLLLLASSVVAPEATYRAVTWVAVDAGRWVDQHQISELLFLVGIGLGAIVFGLAALSAARWLERFGKFLPALRAGGAPVVRGVGDGHAGEPRPRDGADSRGADATAGAKTRGEAPWAMTRILYWVYERRLLQQVAARPAPAHVGIIVDGNRRYGRSRGLLDPEKIYRHGADKLDDVLGWCAELAIPAVTVWVLSTDNFKRSSREVSAILAAVESKIVALGRDAARWGRGVRVRAIGQLDALPPSLLAAIRTTEVATASHTAMTLNIAVGYGGQQEIADAVRALVRDELARGATATELVERIAPSAIERYLYSAELPAPDLIVRTSGELRLSGFLLWQSAHSEFYFTDVPWPALRKIDFLRAIRSYQQRDRRFGR